MVKLCIRSREVGVNLRSLLTGSDGCKGGAAEQLFELKKKGQCASAVIIAD